jgi:hypothetical protein
MVSLPGSSSCTNGYPTSGVSAAVDAAAAGAVTLWEASTGVLAQTWSSWGWGHYSVGGFFYGKAGTLQCTDVVAKCTIDAQASSSDERRVLVVGGADGVFLTGLIIRGGYTVSRGVARGFKRRPDPDMYWRQFQYRLRCPPIPHPTQNSHPFSSLTQFTAGKCKLRSWW